MTPWYEAYKELAGLLDEFYLEHNENAGSVLFKLCVTNEKFLSVNGWFEKFKQKTFEDLESIDPIHVFACLNENRIKQRDKVNRVNLFIEILAGQVVFEDIDFKGCPSPFSIKIMAVRKEDVQQEIWEVFHSVFVGGRKALSEKVFKQYKKWYGIEIASFTIFLFWVNSEEFLPLDKNTMLFVMTGGIIDHRPASYSDYELILDGVESRHYRDLVDNAYEIINRDTPGDFKSQNIHYYFQNLEGSAWLRNDFKIVAIKPGSDLSKRFKKVLDSDQLYCFYDAFDFSNSDFIEYNAAKDIDLYSIANGDSRLKINISAIVGKNGSGKSSIAELFFLTINNLSQRIFGDGSDLEAVDGLDVELYYFARTLYKVSIKGGALFWYKYQTEDGVKYFNPERLELHQKALESYFYTVAINYSHYALNSREIGGWIDGLFHKNDAYQIPIVINPMRKEGNIEINNEKDLVYQRLLTNILGPEKALRKLTDNSRSAHKLVFTVNEKKVERITKDVDFPLEDEVMEIINKVYKFWQIPPANEHNNIIDTAQKYIYRKLATISLKYPMYRGIFNPETSLFRYELFDDYLRRLEADKSHVTNKLKQAVNFLRFPHLKHKDIEKSMEIEILGNQIQTVISENFPKHELRVIELIPPSFFIIEIFLDDNSSFEDLSSGEKQKIYTVSSLVYHLSNLNSVDANSGLVKYEYVNILFDEAELYFHPDMQRTFMWYVLDYLEKVELNFISGLNFCFITHSPLLLSDIPQTNILFLKEKGLALSTDEKIKTFGGNIHELLAESFFLGHGFIGQFAQEKIQETIDFLNGEREGEINVQALKQLIELVGEPFLRDEMLKMLYKRFEGEFDKESEKEKLLKDLKALGYDYSTK